MYKVKKVDCINNINNISLAYVLDSKETKVKERVVTSLIAKDRKLIKMAFDDVPVLLGFKVKNTYYVKVSKTKAVCVAKDKLKRRKFDKQQEVLVMDTFITLE